MKSKAYSLILTSRMTIEVFQQICFVLTNILLVMTIDFNFHLLLDCPKATKIWDLLNLDVHVHDHDEDSSSWLKRHAQIYFGILFPISYWFIWKARNSEVFSDKVILHVTLLNPIYNLFDLC